MGKAFVDAWARCDQSAKVSPRSVEAVPTDLTDAIGLAYRRAYSKLLSNSVLPPRALLLRQKNRGYTMNTSGERTRSLRHSDRSAGKPIRGRLLKAPG